MEKSKNLYRLSLTMIKEVSKTYDNMDIINILIDRVLSIQNFSQTTFDQKLAMNSLIFYKILVKVEDKDTSEDTLICD